MAESTRARDIMQLLRDNAKLSRQDIVELQTIVDQLENFGKTAASDHNSYATPHSYYSNHHTGKIAEITGILDQVEAVKTRG
jgi:hypothetical protein